MRLYIQFISCDNVNNRLFYYAYILFLQWHISLFIVRLRLLVRIAHYTFALRTIFKTITMQQQNCVNRKKTILVEGNIGAGKTTFLQYMERYTNAQIILEPVEKWINLNGINLLQRMYENPEKWSYTFQNYTLLTQLENHFMVCEKDIKIMERSIYSGRYCFAEALRSDGKIQRESFQVFLKWYEFAEKCIKNQTDLIVYLRTSPDIAYDRIQHRDRFEEKAVPFEYICLLHDLHEAWLFDKGTVTHNKIPIFVLDANLSSQTIHTEYERFEQFLLKSSQFNITLEK